MYNLPSACLLRSIRFKINDNGEDTGLYNLGFTICKISKNAGLFSSEAQLHTLVLSLLTESSSGPCSSASRHGKYHAQTPAQPSMLNSTAGQVR